MKIDLNTILIILLAGYIVFMGNCSKPAGIPPMVAAKDSMNKAIERERDFYRDRLNAELQTRQHEDSVLGSKQVVNKIKYDKIPVTVAGYTNQQLKDGFTNY